MLRYLKKYILCYTYILYRQTKRRREENNNKKTRSALLGGTKDQKFCWGCGGIGDLEGGKGLSPTGWMSFGGVAGPWAGRWDKRRAKRREGGRIEEEHSTRGERVKSARRGRQTTGIASPDCWYYAATAVADAHTVSRGTVWVQHTAYTRCVVPLPPPRTSTMPMTWARGGQATAMRRDGRSTSTAEGQFIVNGESVIAQWRGGKWACCNPFTR